MISKDFKGANEIVCWLTKHYSKCLSLIVSDRFMIGREVDWIATRNLR